MQLPLMVDVFNSLISNVFCSSSSSNPTSSLTTCISRFGALFMMIAGISSSSWPVEGLNWMSRIVSSKQIDRYVDENSLPFFFYYSLPLWWLMSCFSWSVIRIESLASSYIISRVTSNCILSLEPSSLIVTLYNVLSPKTFSKERFADSRILRSVPWEVLLLLNKALEKASYSSWVTNSKS